MAKKDIVVIGASAGGMQALEKLAGGLPADLPAALSQERWDGGSRRVRLNRRGNGKVDFQGGGAETGPLLSRLTRETAAPEPLLPAEEREKMEAEVKIAREVDARVEDILQYGQL